MRLERWNPEGGQLKTMTDALMNQRMGGDWRTFWDPTDDMYRLTTILGWIETDSAITTLTGDDSCYFLMTAGEWDRRGGEGPWSGTMTEELYRDSWGTALMDAGRKLLKETVSGENYVLRGPGLGDVPNEIMKELYEALEGWNIGIGINEYCVLTPDKSFGGWFEALGEKNGNVGCERQCHSGAGCQFCCLNANRK